MGLSSHLLSARLGDGNSNYGNIGGSFNSTFMPNEDTKIMRWLSLLELNNRHQGMRAHRLNGVGDCLLKRASFRSGEVVQVEQIRPSCFAPGIRGWGRHI